jgi:hypothetical protein
MTQPLKDHPMIILSLNAKGSGIPSKILALSRMVEVKKTNVVML